MSDAIAKTARRKLALDAARTALLSGAKSKMRSALRELPKDGKKARELSQRLRIALAEADVHGASPIESEGTRATCASDGIEYEFRLGETGDSTLFRPIRNGAHVTVTINTIHPFGRQIAKEKELLNPPLLALFAAWAHYELDQTDSRRESVVRSARIDWGRVVRRLMSADSGFRNG